MKIFIYATFIISIILSLNNITYAETTIAKKIFGEEDCSQFSTKTFAGLADYVRCKRGLEKSDSNFFKSLKLKNKKQKFDPNKPCEEYSTKTFTGLSNKMKCKRAKKY